MRTILDTLPLMRLESCVSIFKRKKKTPVSSPLPTSFYSFITYYLLHILINYYSNYLCYYYYYYRISNKNALLESSLLFYSNH